MISDHDPRHAMPATIGSLRARQDVSRTCFPSRLVCFVSIASIALKCDVPSAAWVLHREYTSWIEVKRERKVPGVPSFFCLESQVHSSACNMHIAVATTARRQTHLRHLVEQLSRILTFPIVVFADTLTRDMMWARRQGVEVRLAPPPPSRCARWASSGAWPSTHRRTSS